MLNAGPPTASKPASAAPDGAGAAGDCCGCCPTAAAGSGRCCPGAADGGFAPTRRHAVGWLTFVVTLVAWLLIDNLAAPMRRDMFVGAGAVVAYPAAPGTVVVDPEIVRAHRDTQTFPNAPLFVSVIAVPFAAFVGYALLVSGSLHDLHHSVLAYAQGMASTQLLTAACKLFGELRPDFWARCGGLDPVTGRCVADGSGQLQDGRQSFFSGHASAAFFCAVFLTYWGVAKAGLIHLNALRPTRDYPRAAGNPAFGRRSGGADDGAPAATATAGAAGASPHAASTSGSGSDAARARTRGAGDGVAVVGCEPDLSDGWGGTLAERRTVGVPLALLLIAGPLLYWAGWVANSRVVDGVHHIRDVVVGSVVGTALATCYYHLWYGVVWELDAVVLALPRDHDLVRRRLHARLLGTIGGGRTDRYGRPLRLSTGFGKSMQLSSQAVVDIAMDDRTPTAARIQTQTFATTAAGAGVTDDPQPQPRGSAAAGSPAAVSVHVSGDAKTN